MEQIFPYNEHNRKNSLKYQDLAEPDGMILHLYGTMEGRRNYWSIYSILVV